MRINHIRHRMNTFIDGTDNPSVKSKKEIFMCNQWLKPDLFTFSFYLLPFSFAIQMIQTDFRTLFKNDPRRSVTVWLAAPAQSPANPAIR